jgi:flagellar basal body-associated protein FliL
MGNKREKNDILFILIIIKLIKLICLNICVIFRFFYSSNGSPKNVFRFPFPGGRFALRSY